MATGTPMKPRRGLFRGKPLRGLIAVLILGMIGAGDVRAQSATGMIGKAINADPQVGNAAQAAEAALKTVATQGESTRGATGAIGQLITDSDILICSAWIVSFRTRYRDMVMEVNADGELDTQEAEALRAMERLMTVVEKACDKVLNREAYETLETGATGAGTSTVGGAPQVVCPECEPLREAYEQRSYEYQRAQLELSRAMGRTDFVNDVHGRNLTPRQRATATGGETPEEAETHEARKRAEAQNAREAMERAKQVWLDCVQRCHDANRRQYGLRDPGLSRNAKIAIGAGAGVVLVGVAAAGGGSDSAPSASPTTTPPLAPFSPAGIYDVTLTVRSDPGGNAPRIGMEPSVWLDVAVNGSTMQYTCPPGTHINPGGGPVDLITGAFNAAGSGPFAGRSGVQFLFPGTFARDGTVTGEYRVGTAGELGQVTTYAVNGRKRQQ